MRSLAELTAGGRLRFRTDSPVVRIKAEWDYLVRFVHFPLTGSCALSLYADYSDGSSKFIHCFIPPLNPEKGYEAEYIVPDYIKADGYTLYFPLYNPLQKLWLGVKEGYNIESGLKYSRKEKVVFYGSSVTQGGCTSKAGNEYEGILSRWFDFDYVNLGFSGNAKGEDNMAEYIVSLSPDVFVYDYDKFVPADILRVLSDYHIDSFCAPPTVFRFLIHEDMTGYDLSALRYCTIAGEALNPSVYEDWLRLTGIRLMEGFGQTETTLTVATYPWVEPRPGSMGKKGPQYDIDLVDADGRSVADGEEGELVIHLDGGRPVGLFREYLDDPELNAKAICGGLYHTGDVAVRDADGYFWFVGRTDDVIKSSGYRIGPFEVENALMSHPAVVECAVTGVPDEIRGQLVKATIVLAQEYRDRDPEELKKEIQDHVKHTTAPYKYPRVVEFVESLPKTISGKIRRVALRQPYKSRNNPEA